MRVCLRRLRPDRINIPPWNDALTSQQAEKCVPVACAAAGWTPRAGWASLLPASPPHARPHVRRLRPCSPAPRLAAANHGSRAARLPARARTRQTLALAPGPPQTGAAARPSRRARRARCRAQAPPAAPPPHQARAVRQTGCRPQQQHPALSCSPRRRRRARARGACRAQATRLASAGG